MATVKISADMRALWPLGPHRARLRKSRMGFFNSLLAQVDETGPN